MKISFNWLKEYIEIKEPIGEIADLLTMSGLEVEAVEHYEEVPGNLEGLVIGQVMTCKKHPQADNLTLTTVDVGNHQLLNIVCGAPNVEAGQTVVVAPTGATLYPVQGEPIKIKKTKIRGEISEGMICAEDEIGLGNSHQGIMVLDTPLKPGTQANEFFQTNQDRVIEIGLTPNRSDAISHVGVCRDLKALLNRPLKWPSVEAFHPDATDQPMSIQVENTEACPRYSGISFRDIKVQESPRWLKNRLRAIGLIPINNIVDATNFVMHELGQPMHAFDADQITGDKIIVKTLKEGTTFVTLDGKARKLNAHDLMICDGQEQGLCIAGIFGGIKSGVTDATVNLFLESACFSADYIRKTAQSHGLKTDASFRFERGTDPNLTVIALKRAAILIKELAGGRIVSDIVDIYPKELDPVTVSVQYSHVDRLIGKQIPREKIHDILEHLDIETLRSHEQGFEAKVPLYRHDVTREADIIEEILRIYGYNNIELQEHYGSSYLADFPLLDVNKTRFGLAKMLASLGFWEIYTNSLTKSDYTDNIPHFDSAHNVVILNKLSEDLGVLRQTLLFTGLESVAYNLNHRQSNLKLFEFGKVYRLVGEGADPLDKYEERQRLALYMTGNNQEENWQDPTRPLAFHDLSAVIHKTLDNFNISAYNSRVIETGIFEYGLEITVSDNSLVQLGKLTSEVCALADIKQPVFYADLDWEWLVQQPKDKIEFNEVSRYPEVRRDLSLVLDKAVLFSQIEKLAYDTERQILRRINVFDVYEGDKIESGKKAYAMSFILQDKKRTLTDKIIDKCMTRLMHSFEQELGAIIRK